MLIKKEVYVNDNGQEMVKHYFGTDENNITSTVECAVSDDIQEMPETEPEPTQMDRIEAQTAYIAMMME